MGEPVGVAVTGRRARDLVHDWRRSVDAIAVGSGTAIADDPLLTARRGGRIVHRPTRVVIDSRLRVAAGARLYRAPGERIALASRRAPAIRRRALEARGVRVIGVPARGRHLDLRRAWGALAAAGINEVLVEGGGGLAAALLRAGLVDRLQLFMAPLLIGGDGRAVLANLGVERLAGAPHPQLSSLRRVGDDILVTADWPR